MKHTLLYFCILLFISVSVFGQKQMTDYGWRNQLEDRFFKTIGKTDDTIYSISENNVIWAYNLNSMQFDSITTIPPHYWLFLENDKLYFNNNQAVWQFDLVEKSLNRLVSISPSQRFEIKDNHCYILDNSGYFLIRYELENTSKVDTLTTSRHYFDKSDHGVFIQEFDSKNAKSKLLFTDSARDYRIEINALTQLRVFQKTASALILKGDSNGKLYVWELDNNKIETLESSKVAQFYENPDSSIIALQYYHKDFKSFDSLLVSKVKSGNKSILYSGSVDGYFWDRFMVAGVILVPHLSNMVVKNDQFYFMSYNVSASSDVSTNNHWTLRLSKIDLKSKQLEHIVCPSEMLNDFLESTTFSETVYKLESEGEQLAIFPNFRFRKKYIFDTTKEAFLPSDSTVNYHRGFINIDNNNFVRIEWNTVLHYNKNDKVLETLPRKYPSPTSQIIQSYKYNNYVLTFSLDNSNTVKASIFDGRDTNALTITTLNNSDKLQAVLSRASKVIDEKYVLAYFSAQDINSEGLTSLSFVLNLAEGTVKRFEEDILSGIELSNDYTIKHLYKTKVLVENNRIIDLKDLMVEDFKIDYNHYLRHFTTTGFFVFSKDDTLKYYNVSDKKTKPLSNKSYYHKSFNKSKLVFSDGNALRIFYADGSIKELLKREDLIMNSSVFDLSNNLILIQTSKDYQYALIDLFNDSVTYFKSSGSINSAIDFGSNVYYSTRQDGLYRFDMINQRVHSLGKRIITEFFKSNNDKYIYASEQIITDNISWRYLKIEDDRLTELFTTGSIWDPSTTIFDTNNPIEKFFLDIEAGKGIVLRSELLREITNNSGYVVLNTDNFLIFHFNNAKYAYNKINNELSKIDISETIGLDGLLFENKFFFLYKDTGIGTEIWQTDGTAGGTFLAYDINPGPNGSNPEKPFILKNNLFVFATTPKSGLQLWQLTDNEPKDNEEDILLSTENPTVNFSFYPNPTQDYLNVSSTSETENKYKITVFGTDGKVVSEQNLELPQKLDLSNLKDGTYLINIRAGKDNKTFRVVKQ